MAVKRIKAKSPGVRYHEHESRKHGVRFDRYYSIRYKLGGKDKEEGLGWSSQGWTEQKAVERLAELKENHRKGEGPQTLQEKREIAEQKRQAEQEAKEQTEKENITFDTFMKETYLPQSKQDKKERTYGNEEMLYRLYISDKIGKLPFPKITAFHIEGIKKKMSDKGLSDRTIQYMLQIVRHIFNVAKKRGIFKGESPTNAVKWPKLDNMKLRYLSIDEAERLLDALAAKSQSLHDIALLSLHCGLRFGEIAALTWSCVNMEAGTLAILNAKTGSRTAYLTKRAKAMLEARKQDKKNDELIFPKRSGKAGSMIQASKVFNLTVAELAFNDGITDRKQKVTFHTLRHTFATHLYENTNDLYLTQRSLGHSTGTMTQRYAKMSENRLREGAAALEKAFQKNNIVDLQKTKQAK